MAVDATARLYDVDEDTVVFKKLDKTEKYDQGVVTFRARKGKLIDLDKLHESVWATRLSGGTRSGLVSLEVTAVGTLVNTQNGVVLEVEKGKEFVLKQNKADGHASTFSNLMTSIEGNKKIVKVTGVIENYQGRWPSLFRKKPDSIRNILVTNYEVIN